MRGFRSGLVSDNGIWCLVLGWWVVDGRWALWSSPVALSNEEGTSDPSGVYLSAWDLDQFLLSLYDGAGLALVIDTEDLRADLEFLASRGGGERLEEGHGALSVDNAGGVEFRDVWDCRCALGLVEVDDFLAGVLEC